MSDEYPCDDCPEWTDMFGCAFTMGGQPCPHAKKLYDPCKLCVHAADHGCDDCKFNDTKLELKEHLEDEGERLTIVYMRGYSDGKEAAIAEEAVTGDHNLVPSLKVEVKDLNEALKRLYWAITHAEAYDHLDFSDYSGEFEAAFTAAGQVLTRTGIKAAIQEAK